MDYEQQVVYLRRYRRAWLFLPGLGSLLLLVVLWQAAWERILATLFFIGLAFAAYYLPNYLCLAASPRKRLAWVARVRWILFGVAALVCLPAARLLPVLVWSGGLAGVTAVFLWTSGTLRAALPSAPLAARSSHRQTRYLAVLHLAAPAAFLFLTWRYAEASPPLVLLLFLAFSFVFLVLFRFEHLAAHLLVAGAVSVFAYGIWPQVNVLTGSALWVFGAAHLLARAERQHLRNYEHVLQQLQEFSREQRDTVVELLRDSTAILAADWQRTQPTGQAAVEAWYRRNARYYLYDITQHHLLYKHIVFTLALFRLARGRVLDFGGGNGDFACGLARRGLDVTYFDLPGQSAEFVRWRTGRENLRLTVVTDTSALQGPFDTVFCLDVLEHLVDVRPVIQLWNNLLRPGGRLVTSVYQGPASSAPMHIDPGFDVRAYLLGQGFRDVKPRGWRLWGCAYVRKPNLLILERTSN